MVIEVLGLATQQWKVFSLGDQGSFSKNAAFTKLKFE